MINTHSLYIHIPYCISKCKYCDFFSKACGNSIPEDYISALKNELKKRLCGQDVAKLKSIYLGGGTPSLLTKIQLSEILDTVKKYSHIEDECEITIEVNPDDVCERLLKDLGEVGITRLSVGIQSMNNTVLEYAGRRAKAECNIKALNCIKENWKGILSVDLICAMPFETSQTFQNGLMKVLSYEPEHISLYSLTIEEETPFGKMYENNEFDYDWDKADLMWLEGRDILKKYGYIQYEVSNFCKDGFECKHNLTYWNHENYIGVGAGGTGTIYPHRWTNTTDLHSYINFWNQNYACLELPQIEEEIELKTAEFEFFMMGLRKLEGIKDSEYMKFFGKKIPADVVLQFEKWQKNGLTQIEIIKDDKIYKLTEKGILFLNKFLEELEI